MVEEEAMDHSFSSHSTIVHISPAHNNGNNNNNNENKESKEVYVGKECKEGLGSPPSLTDSALGVSYGQSGEERFECYGENADVETNVNLDNSVSSVGSVSPKSSPTPFARTRHAWARTSLRRASHHGNREQPSVQPRRWGSFRHPSGSRRPALALDRSVASSGRSSNCDENDSDISIEEDVNDLNHKFEEDEFEAILEYDLWPGQLSLSSTPNESTSSSMLGSETKWGSDSISQMATSTRPALVRLASDLIAWQEQETLIQLLENQVQELQEQVGALSSSQASSEAQYLRLKSTNSSLTSRIHALEEQLRDLELRSQETLEQEQRRHKEILLKMDREKALQMDNLSLRLQSSEQERMRAEEELQNTRQVLEKVRQERQLLEQRGQEQQEELQELQSENEQLLRSRNRAEQEQQQQQHLIEELSNELDTFKREKSNRLSKASSPMLLRTVSSLERDADEEMQKERERERERQISVLRERNRELERENDDLNGQILNKSVEQGKSLLEITATNDFGGQNGQKGGGSLADEFKRMSDEEDAEANLRETTELRLALREQQDVNSQLRHYIDGILMSIIERYPELLEVRR